MTGDTLLHSMTTMNKALKRFDNGEFGYQIIYIYIYVYINIYIYVYIYIYIFIYVYIYIYI